MYIHHLPDYPDFEAAFTAAGYVLEVDLSNSLIIEDKEGNWITYDDLSAELRGLMDAFAEKHGLTG